MHVSIDYIINHPNDFKVCKCCGKINWYENDACVDCGCRDFRELGTKDCISLEDRYGDTTIEIDV